MVVHRDGPRGPRPPPGEPVRAAPLRRRRDVVPEHAVYLRERLRLRARPAGGPDVLRGPDPRHPRLSARQARVPGRTRDRRPRVCRHHRNPGVPVADRLVRGPGGRQQLASQRPFGLAPSRSRIRRLQPVGGDRRRAPRRRRRHRDPTLEVGLGRGAARARARPRHEQRGGGHDRPRAAGRARQRADGRDDRVRRLVARIRERADRLSGRDPSHEPLAVGRDHRADRRALPQPRAGPGAARPAAGGRRPQPRAGLLARRPARVRGRRRAAARSGQPPRPCRDHRRAVGKAGRGAHPRPGAGRQRRSSSRRSAARPAWPSRTSSSRRTCARGSAPSSSPSVASASCSRTST